jgi:hypothetical protein
MNLSKESRLVAGITLLTIPTIDYGGSFLLNSLTDPGHTRESMMRCDRLPWSSPGRAQR